MSFIIGIDSGGTHIVSQVIDVDGNIKERFEVGPGNILVDYDKTRLNLFNLINQIKSKYGNQWNECKAVIIGIAGLDTFGGGSELKDELNLKFGIPIILMSDAMLALWNILSGKKGVVALAGTGSAIFSRFNNIQRVGGWGYLFGDEGSAFDISRRTLKFLTIKYDNQENNSFASKFIQELGKNNVPEVIADIYKMNRKQIANLALITSELSNQYPEALQIIEDSANSLADQALLMLKRWGNKSELLIGESGSVLQKNRDYQFYFEKRILGIYPKVKFVYTSRNNSFGAFYWYQENKED
ncbi:BadF/BadG/BcrA/BcrD ATPase family protein [Companilactobacillus alimentarius]|uniref:ATPase BadF/BadG/BcrA/BcrD type domain-containing protein n=1 Tax=Companilactobacillus alimentarius DSM 20249 TaxID=1423720 RepID=A0A2K9HJZ2_9LACO|nr:BadF/BadG/BcrA/BcrD ATPase family protein [Companilactobacillus alimentarius]AUI72086.1 hypothetical protein LA20249_07800 [Companilactobacillus alimentarius DSM 20249]KRK78043.1 N-acetylglucosamine kinase [Companilactobacillus alimentarius DSM 20249]MDT6952623.1 BadF/BadG/BcrA/BcrD ATPase family protein [Companilactobacillus alimentarius]GEO44861.1 N-acetylglucosamine kinase [Companilactobacillus alimentarius]